MDAFSLTCMHIAQHAVANQDEVTLKIIFENVVVNNYNFMIAIKYL